MSDMSDLLPARDGVFDLGAQNNMWAAVYALYISDGVVTRAVGDLATREDYNLMSRLPSLTQADDGKFLTVYNQSFELSAAPPGVLPPINPSNNGMYLVSRNGQWIPAYMPVLPVVTVAENDWVLKVFDGSWRAMPAPLSLPYVTVMDNGKILQVYMGVWQAVSPPSDVLPPVDEGDHGSVLMAENENTPWTKWKLGRATTTRDGLVPKLPMVRGRVLMGDNTWAAAPTGASGQWVIGDIRETLRDPGYGWRRLDGDTLVPSVVGEEYHALYRAVGKTEAEWAGDVPLTLLNRPNAYIRMLPDTVASVNFGITMLLQPGGGPTHVELELYRHPSDVNTVLQTNTYFKLKTDFTFTAKNELTYNSSSPGFFIQDGPIWRLFQSGGETITQNTVVLFDTGEASFGPGVNEVVAAGGYYYRWRQVNNGVPMDWVWNRILTTGGVNREEAQVVKLCDIFATGRLQKWKSPAIAVSIYAVSEAGLEELVSDENDRVEVGTRLKPGSMLSLVGHGNTKLTGAVDRLDMFSTVPQYTAVEMNEMVPVITPFRGYSSTPYTSLFGYWIDASNPITDGSGSPFTDYAPNMRPIENGVIFFIASDGAIGSRIDLINLDTMSISQNDAYYGRGNVGPNYRYFYGKVNGRECPISIPENDGTAYYDRGAYREFFSRVYRAIPEAERVGWEYPFFTSGHYINDRNFLIPGEAPGIWDLTEDRLIPLPEGTIFRGGLASTLGPDGCIYAMPRFTNSDISRTRSTGMLRFDPFTDEISFISIPWELVAIKTDVYGWHKAIMLKDGRLLFVPYGEPDFVIYDVRYQSFSRTTFGQTLPNDFKWANAGVLGDGTVVGIGTDADGRGSMCFRFYPDMTTMETFTFAYPLSHSIRSMVAAPDGSLFVAAFELIQNNVRIFRIKAGEPKYRPGTHSPCINKS